MSKQIGGVVPIMAAVFTRSGVLDDDGFQSLVRHLLTVGAPALTLFGLATEFYKLTDHERARLHSLLLAETCKSDSVAGIISITDHSWEVACQRALAAEQQGADALMLPSPSYTLDAREVAQIDQF